MLNATVHRQTQGNYPAPLNILRCVFEGLQVPLDAGLRIETRYFMRTLASPQALAMIRTLFLSAGALARGAARPPAPARRPVQRAAVLGAGMMGAGIAHAHALAGIDTALVDVSAEAAEKGGAQVRRLLDRAAERGALTAAAAAAALDRIRPTADYGDVAGADLVVEAVFEDRGLKAEVTRRAEAVLGPDAVFGSNTSSLPITGLAEASRRPENFIGIHFFSPVDRMALVEVIRGRQTTDETLARVLDYVLALRKTPIVVRDSRGFYTTRCFVTFIDEGMEMLLDGIAPALIDNLGRRTGMPRGPLEMSDDVALDLIHKGRLQEQADLGPAYVTRRTDALVAALVEQHGRHGRKNGRGFYDYPAEPGKAAGAKTLWPGLAQLAPVQVAQADAALAEEMRQRLLYRPALEAVRCLEEGVIAEPRDGDVGAVLGIGFAQWTGGPFSLIDGVGPAAFVAACDRLAARHGPRFRPPALLREMARDPARRFYGPLVG
jgi:3-hydroxyacyl-CoA dehydrogenase/enoyl-CoA hydratase/3-hydroxybutyryl-CoA epimerase